MQTQQDTDSPSTVTKYLAVSARFADGLLQRMVDSVGTMALIEVNDFAVKIPAPPQQSDEGAMPAVPAIEDSQGQDPGPDALHEQQSTRSFIPLYDSDVTCMMHFSFLRKAARMCVKRGYTVPGLWYEPGKKSVSVLANPHSDHKARLQGVLACQCIPAASPFAA